MAVSSDPRDWEVWQAIHNAWAKLVNEEMAVRSGRPSDFYEELMRDIGPVDERDVRFTGSASSSEVSATVAFERGYMGGWAR